MAERPQLVLFDCDGVLVDTEIVSSRTLAEMLTERGVPTDGDELRIRMRGTSLDWIKAESARQLGGTMPDGWIEEFTERRLVVYRQGVPQMLARPMRYAPCAPPASRLPWPPRVPARRWPSPAGEWHGRGPRRRTDLLG